MEDADIEQRFHLMQKEIEATLSLMRDNKLDLMAAIDSIKIELEVLKMYMERFSSRLCGLLSKIQRRGGPGDRS